MPNRQLEQRRIRARRLIASILATVYLCGSEGPMLLALAAPSWFVRPGAGVSSQPLGVSSFGAPGFGELSQAVNMANGNVFASAGGLSFNNQMQSGDENTNKIGGSNWNLTSRLRLNGFSRTSNANFGTDNLTLNQNISSSYYGGHWIKPNVIPVNRFSRPAVDTGCSTQTAPASASGIRREMSTPIAPGTYRVAVDVRGDANYVGLFGLSDYKYKDINVTTSWQRFTADFTIAPGENLGGQAARLFEVRENVTNNPAWEVANISVQLMTGTTLGPNLITDQDARSAYWTDYCVLPPTEVFYRLQKADYTGNPGTNDSGLTRVDTFFNGTYKVSLEGRTRNGSLDVLYGVHDGYLQASTLTTAWQTLTKTFSVTSGQLDRVFEIYETTANNPDWELRNISVQRISPGSFTISSGDGSSRFFKQITPNFATTPSWITRYQTTTGTTFYALESQPGTQYIAEWLVLRQIGTNYVAHYYTSGGSRVTFSGDGEYADFTQNPYQQLRGASATTPDLEGTAVSTPKTEISYTSANSGLISKIKDEWGRVTTYEWNTTDKTLTRINELLRDEASNSSFARKTEFEYGVCFNGVCGNQRAVTKVTHTAPDGKGNMVSRSTSFDYQWRANNTRLMLAKVSRSVLGNQNEIRTVYTYGFDDQLTQVDTVDNGGVAVEPAIKYIYAMASTVYRRNNNLGEITLKPTRTPSGLEYRVPAKFATDLYEARLEPKSDARLEWTRNGNRAAPVQLKRGKTATLGRFNIRPGDLLELRGSQGASVKLIPLMAGPGPLNTNVIVMQGAVNDPNRKQTRLAFDSSGQLTEKTVRDYNPWLAASSWAVTADRPVSPSLTTSYTYTATGSTSSIMSPAGRKDIYSYDAAGNVTKLETYKKFTDAAPERSTTYTYDLDNRQTSETVLATSGTRDGASYAYLENKKTSSYALFTASVGGQSFTPVQTITEKRLIGNVEKRSYTQTFDVSGRLLTKATASSGLTGVTTTFTYHTGSTYGEWLPNWTQGTPAKQYGDLVVTSSNGNLSSDHYYNQFGDLILKVASMALASDINNSNQFVADRSNRKDVVNMRAYNGFGQMLMDRLYEYGRVASEQQFNYYATGELDSSWEGQPSNTTDYRPELSGANLGRVTTIVKGIGDGNGITTTREYTSLEYDAFGRVTTKTVDGFATKYKYDALDRTVSTLLPNGKEEAAAYHSSGVQNLGCDFGGGSSGISPAAQPDPIRCTYNYEIDGLGRPTYTTVATNPAGSRTTYYTYDPYDRPIKVYNDWLPMVAAGNDRSTYLAYDSEGNLTKQLGAVLGNDIYTDPRRPYTEYVYDGFNRKTSEAKLTRSPSPVSPSSMVMPSGAGTQVATTTYEYNAWNRMIRSVDADGWNTYLGYDALGNIIEKQQQVCPDNTGECAQHFSDEDSVKTNGYAGTYYAYDAAGRLTATLDARNQTSRTVYNAFGLPQYIVDARGVTTKAINYTGDGLLSSIYEPDNNPGTTANLANDGNAGGYVVTKSFDYTSRKYPTASCVSGINNTTAGCTGYQYDFAGRPTLTSLPLGGTIEQGYDGRGHLTRLKDADGFVTEYRYDAWGQLLDEKKLRRSGTTDMTALPNDLFSSYAYDQAGNLTVKQERGLYTRYKYNSLGKVQAETRPYQSGGQYFWKYYTYRVDGVKTAETTYDYAGSLTSSQYNTVDCWDTNAPNVASGNAQCWGDITALGRAGTHASFGVSSAVNGGAYTRERMQWDAYNGLGLRYKRSFYGIASIYAQHRTINGALNGDGEATLWRFDANGNMLKSYKRGISGNGGAYTDGAISDSSLASDVFTYKYSPTNKQTDRSGEVRVYSGSTLIGRTAGASTESSPVLSPGGVTTQSVGALKYTDRDTVVTSSVTDTDVRGNTVTRNTGYDYYLDGSRSKVTVVGVGTVDYTYDARGRMVQAVDSNGANGVGGPVTSSFAYASDGSVTESLTNGNYSSTRTPTIGGLTAKVSGSSKPGWNGCPSGSTDCLIQQNVWTYDANGRVTQQLNTQQPQSQAASTNLTEYSYDAYSNNNSRFDTRSGGSRIQSYSAVFSSLNAVQSEVTNPPGGSGIAVTHNYALNSRGMRLKVSGEDIKFPERGATKRYDAEDRAADFDAVKPFREAYNTQIDGASEIVPAEGSVTTALRFRYDPMGDLALSVQATISVFPDLGNQTQIKSSASVLLDGRVHVMHALNSETGVRWVYRSGDGWSSTGNTININTPEDQDESFSLADGVANSNQNFNILAPFNATPIDSSAIPLASPISPLSSQVRVEPSAIQAPGNAPPSSDPGAITAPSSPIQPSTTAGTETGFSSSASLTNTTVSSQGVSAPTVGVQSFSISSATTTATSGSTAQPAPTKPVSSEPAAFSSQINLEPPSSVLPPSITPLSASSIAAPSSFTLVLPASGDVSSIIAPGSSSVPVVGATPSSGTGTIVPPSSSVTPPGGSSGGIVRPGGGSSVATVKPLDVTITPLNETFKPATTLGQNAALTQAAVQALMGEIERRARLFAEDQLTTAYGGDALARSQARNDLQALDGYLQASDHGQRDRIYMYAGLAVGLQTGKITLAEWKAELKELCGYRASASGGANASCDRAIGRNAYLPVPCPTASDPRFQVPCNPAGPAKAVNSPITDRAQRNQFGRWLYGGFNLGQRPSYLPGAQLTQESVGNIVARAEQAFYQVSVAYCKGVKRGGGVSIGGSAESGVSSVGSAGSGSFSLGMVQNGNNINLLGFFSYGGVSGNFNGVSGQDYVSAVEPTVPGLKPSVSGASFSFGISAWSTNGGSFGDLKGAFDSTSVTLGPIKGSGNSGSFSTGNGTDVGAIGLPTIPRIPSITLGLSSSSYTTTTPDLHFDLSLASNWCK